MEKYAMLGGKVHGVRKAVRAVSLNRKFHPSTGEISCLGSLGGQPIEHAKEGLDV